MELLTKEIREFVNKQKLGFIATVCADGTPNLSPKGTTIGWDEEHLAFADIHSPTTVENLLNNPSIEINVVDIFVRKGYRFKGTASILSSGPMFEKIFHFYQELGLKYQLNHIVMVKVDRVQPLFSPVYDTPITEEEVKNRWLEYWNSTHRKTSVAKISD